MKNSSSGEIRSCENAVVLEFEVDAEMYRRPARSPMYLQQFPLRKPPDLVLPKPKKEKPSRGKGRRKKK